MPLAASQHAARRLGRVGSLLACHSMPEADWQLSQASLRLKRAGRLAPRCLSLSSGLDIPTKSLKHGTFAPSLAAPIENY
jgi:hypothetical protein